MISNFDHPVTCTNSSRRSGDSVAKQISTEIGCGRFERNAVDSSAGTSADPFDSSLLTLESIRSKLARFKINSEDFDRYLSSFLGRTEQEQTEERDPIGSERLTELKCEPTQSEFDANPTDQIKMASNPRGERAPSVSGGHQSASLATSRLTNAAFCLEETDSNRATICTEPTRRVQVKERHRFHRWREKADRVSALLNRITIKTDFEIKRSRRAGGRRR